MNFETINDAELVASSIRECDGHHEDLTGIYHDESACAGCRAWAEYLRRGAPRLSVF